MSVEQALQLVRLAKQLARERTDADPVVQRLLNKSVLEQQWEAQVPAEWRTVGFVQALTAASADMQGKDLPHAESLARFALVVAGSIPAGKYPDVPRTAAEAGAWKELANAHRLQSRYGAALRALDAAELCLSAPSQSYDRAVMQFARALVYSDQRLFSDASELLIEAKTVFAQYEDRTMTGQCLLLQGMNEQRQGNLQDACETYKRAIEFLKDTYELHTLAAAYNNWAYALIDLGDLDGASSALHNACAIFNDLGLRPSVARARAAIGKILLAMQKYDLARNLLSEVRLIFLGLHMPEEAGIVGLYLAESWLGLGKADRAARIVDEVAREFETANLNARRRDALAWLRERIPTARGLAAVRHVRSYVEQARREPQRVFVPLPEDT